MSVPSASRHLYKQYVRIAAKWPKDANKAPERDFANFLSKEVERQFKQAPPPSSTAICEKRLQALDQLLNNEIKKKYPNEYTSGVFGMRLEDLQMASSEENRKQMGLKPKESIFKKMFRAVVPEKKKA
uniref:Mitochondrial protein M19 n=1 Tax=Caenorhabditis tropicalis TaxID=1561998 RepID=A0A1I7TQE3_9PELO